MNSVLYYATLRGVRPGDHQQQASRQLLLQKGEVEPSELLDYEQQFNVESWYSGFSSETFDSSFQPVSRDEARALLFDYGQNVLHGHIDEQELRVIGGMTDTEKDALITTLNDRIQAAMDQLSGTPDAASFFVRLSARSPKDSAIGSLQMRERLAVELAKMQDSDDDCQTQNHEFCAFFRAQISSLCVKNAAQALELIRRSERVNTDLKTVLTLPAEWDQRVIIRRWNPAADPAGEFRCFVFNKQLTAISQYFHFVCFPDIPKHCATIERAIRNYFETKIIDKLPWDCCVMDVLLEYNRPLSAFMPSDEDLLVVGVQIIEFNPFTRFTSSSLFSWLNPSDTQILRGEAPFQFRYLHRPLPFVGRPKSDLVLPALPSELMSEYSSIFSLVQEYFEDDFARINSVLRYQFRQEIFEHATNAYLRT